MCDKAAYLEPDPDKPKDAYELYKEYLKRFKDRMNLQSSDTETGDAGCQEQLQ